LKAYKAPFYFNIKFYQPGGDNPKKNSAHIRYIATRPGVEFGKEMDTNMELDLDSPEHHVKYAHERPRSHGLFSSGEEDINMFEIQKELKEHEGHVWRLILSLEGEDAKRLEMESREAWEEVIKTQLPQMAYEMGIQESNLRWVAAFHAEVDHPHSHVVFWEKKPKRRMGKVSLEVKDKMRKKFVQKIYAADRDRFGKEKTMMRDMMRGYGLTTLKETVQFAREWKNAGKDVSRFNNLIGRGEGSDLVPKFNVKQMKELTQKLNHLSGLLPKRGRLSLKFMPENVKLEVRKIAEWMYGQSQLNPLRVKYEDAAELLARPYTTQEIQLKEAVDKAKQDMIDRISQVVIKGASEIVKDDRFMINPDLARETVERFRFADGAIVEDQEKRLLKMIAKQLHAANIPKEVFLKILASLNLDFGKDDLSRAFAGMIDIKPEKLSKNVAYLLKAYFGESEIMQILKAAGYVADEFDKVKNLTNVKRDVKSLLNVFGVKSAIHTVLDQMSTVLLSCGLSMDEAKGMILGWAKRSNTQASQHDIEEAVRKASKAMEAEKEWGRTPFLSPQQFKRLSKALDIEDAPSPWRSKRESEFAKNGHNHGITTKMFKSVFNQLEVLMKRMEAEKEHEHMKLLNRIRVNAEREQEEKERGDKSKGR
jgi:hypothetical protein